MVQSLLLVAGQQAVEQDGHEGSRHDAALTADELDELGGVGEDLGVCTHAVAHAQRHRDDGQGAGSHLLLGDELDARHHDGGEHHDGSAAQNGLGHDGDECAQLGDEAAEHQEDGTGGQCAPVDHLGHGHEAHVLAEGSVGQDAEAGGDGGAEAVADDAAAQLLIGGLAAHAALHDAGDVAHRLHGGDDEHDHDGQDGAEVEDDLDRHQLRDGEPAGLSDLVPVQHPCFGELHAVGGDAGGGQDETHDDGCQIARDDAHEDGGRAEEAIGPVLEEEDDHQHEDGQQQVLHRAEVLGCVAAAEGVDAHGDEGQTDGQHDRAGDHRREQLAQGLQKDAQHALEQAAQNGCAHHGAVGRDAAAHGGSHAVEHAQEARAGTHDDRHFAAHRAEAVQLHQRDDARHEHGVLQQAHLQVCELTAREAAGAGDDEQRGEVAHEHGEHVLQSQRDSVAQRHFRLKLVCRIFQFSAFYHIPGSFTSLQVFVTSIENYSRPEPGTVGLFRVFIHIFVISRTYGGRPLSLAFARQLPQRESLWRVGGVSCWTSKARCLENGSAPLSRPATA